MLPFNGPQAKKAEAVVVRTLRKQAKLIDHTKWQAAAKKLFAPSHSSEDLSAVANDQGVKVVVTGVVKRDGRNWQLTVSLHDGPTGRSRDRLKYPLGRTPRLEGRTLELLGKEVATAFEHALDAAASGDEPAQEEAPAKATSKPETAKQETKKPAANVRPIDEAPDEKAAQAPTTTEPPVAEKEEHPPGLAEPAAAPSAAPAKSSSTEKRPRWAPWFDVTAGGSLGGRSWDFLPSSLPHFQSGVVAGVHVDATLYPLAGTWRSAKGVFAGLGIGATLDKPFWPASKGPDGNSYPTDELHVFGGIRWRIPLIKALPRPELLINLGGGYHSFAITKKMDPVTGNLVDVGPPDVAYAYLGAGLGIRLHFAEWMAFVLSFTYHLVLDDGPATTNAEYGPATTFGLRPAGGFEFFLYRGLKLSLMAYYERYNLTFTGSDPAPMLPGQGEVAQSAVDQFFGGTFSIGYEF